MRQRSPSWGYATWLVLWSALCIGGALLMIVQIDHWFLGSLLLAVAMIQWFVLMHEAGHGTLFPNQRANLWLGRLAGFLCGLPFSSWKHVHSDHHVWTGWKDRDPTTVMLTRIPPGAWQRRVMKWCWKLYLPLFSLSYRLSNFWSLPRLAGLYPRHFPTMKKEVLVMGLAYGLVVFLVDPWPLVVAYLIHLVISEPVMLSQHTHVPQKLAGGADTDSQAKPFAVGEQAEYTRSVSVPQVVSRLVLFGFERHVEHHENPRVPGYFLESTIRCRSLWRFFVDSHRHDAETIFFSDRRQTGLEL